MSIAAATTWSLSLNILLQPGNEAGCADMGSSLPFEIDFRLCLHGTVSIGRWIGDLSSAAEN